MTDDEQNDELELSPEQVEEGLERFRAANPSEDIDENRLAAVLRAIWDDAVSTSPPEVAAQLREFVSLGAHIRTEPADEGIVRVRLGTDKRSIPLGRFRLEAVGRPLQG